MKSVLIEKESVPLTRKMSSGIFTFMRLEEGKGIFICFFLFETRPPNTFGPM